MFISAHSDPLSCVFAASKLITSWSTPNDRVPPRLTDEQAAAPACDADGAAVARVEAVDVPVADEAWTATSTARMVTPSAPPTTDRRCPVERRPCLMSPPEVEVPEAPDEERGQPTASFSSCQ